MFNEFKKFALRGNVIDLAIGVIIGAAFTSVVNSLVKDIITPPLGLVTGGLDFSNLFFVLKGGNYATLADAAKAGAVTINYGQFLNAAISFLIVAFVLFLFVRWINTLFAPKAAPAAPPPPPEDVVLLREIRDLLKARP
ncbi:MAG: large conductance mechanosensitive channel protein MscL [Alphaproteobacteria bacterium]|nr:large conductance mechanosensitive channel protein MscL [Alphaproteobacteria bacterium]